jgi:hypothetical protein
MRVIIRSKKFHATSQAWRSMFAENTRIIDVDATSLKTCRTFTMRLACGKFVLRAIYGQDHKKAVPPQPVASKRIVTAIVQSMQLPGHEKCPGIRLTG